MGKGIVQDFRDYAKDPARWVYRYQDQCRFHNLTEEELQNMKNKKPKFRIEIIKNPTPQISQPYYWRAVSINNKIIAFSEKFKSQHGPKKTLISFIEAIRAGDFTIVENIAE
jgi:hypothetical protein